MKVLMMFDDLRIELVMFMGVVSLVCLSSSRLSHRIIAKSSFWQ